MFLKIPEIEKYGETLITISKFVQDSPTDPTCCKEATFQHLFDEALSEHLPLRTAIVPELNTKIVDRGVGFLHKWHIEVGIGNAQERCQGWRAHATL